MAAPAAPGLAQSDKRRWRMVTSWPKNVAERIGALSGGRFEITVSAAGEVVPAFEVLDAVGSGVAEMGHTATSLARMLNEEPVQPQDLQMMGMLLPLGIEKGKEFKPDPATVAQLNSADEIWEYSSTPESWRALAGSAGFVLVRQKTVVDVLEEIIS